MSCDNPCTPNYQRSEESFLCYEIESSIMKNSFSEPILRVKIDPLSIFRRKSRGYLADPPAKIHTNILFGAGAMLTENFIQDNHITHIINCALPIDCPEKVQKKFESKYICLEAIDSPNVNITAWYPKFEFFMNQFLKDKTCETVYVHCQAGINRSGFLTLLYCCVRFGYPFIPTCKAIVAQRPCALQNYVFFQQVREYIAKNVGKV
jgi:hypothetical protein